MLARVVGFGGHTDCLLKIDSSLPWAFFGLSAILIFLVVYGDVPSASGAEFSEVAPSDAESSESESSEVESSES